MESVSRYGAPSIGHIPLVQKLRKGPYRMKGFFFNGEQGKSERRAVQDSVPYRFAVFTES